MYCHPYPNHLWAALCTAVFCLPPQLQEQELCYPSTQICWGCSLHSLQPFTQRHMGHVHQSQQHHSRSFFINRFISDAGPRSQHFPDPLWHCRLNKHRASAAKQVPSFMFSCLWNSVISSHSTLSGRSRWQMCSAYNIVFTIPCLLAEQWKKHLEARICSIFSVLGNWAKKIAQSIGRGGKGCTE